MPASLSLGQLPPAAVTFDGFAAVGCRKAQVKKLTRLSR